MAYAGKELLNLRPKGAKGGETKRDEIKVMRPASARMPVTLTLVNICKSSVSPTTASW